ncbi:DUF1694 domain-containing protein [Streptococcus sp. DD13]|uniref:DUF1694 domain-containing protein n=1 Tax=Streptococcus sp. DD13 TaxID=1777881 RepID=UPI000791F328|nr:DUF1694 domain-containing protein [Streptococcus sp. DD13]KXT79101.1 hypothetical protein STRDD13_00220 [Streptococcus sp. DD13]
MKDLTNEILQKASGENRLHPDEQKKFLETYEERVIGECSIADANSPLFRDNFSSMLEQILAAYQPVTIKISPNVQNSYQIFYLKVAHEHACTATIVSDQCSRSPFGLIIHTDHPVSEEQKDLTIRYATLLHPDGEKKNSKKSSFWGKLFH